MKINLFCLHFLFWTFSVIFSTILSSSSSSSSSSISLLGIGPEDEKYFKTEILRCRNGSKKFTRAQLNDDFCDCPDGTDEPGTSACPQGKFYCQNTGHQPILLYSSRVNDGICDCCDGSDEYDGRVKCPNVCWEAGKLAMDKLQKKIELYREGVTIRRKEVEQAKQEVAKDKAELSKLKYEEKILKRLVKQLEVRKEQVEKAKKKEHLDKEKDEKMKEVPEDKDGTGNKSDDEQKESSGTTADDKIGPVKEPLKDQPEKDEYENNEGLSSDTSEINEISREELGRLVASRWTGDKTEHQGDEIGAARDVMRDTDETLEITRDEANGNKDGKDLSKGNDNDGSSSSNKEGFVEQKDLPGRTTSRTPSWLEKILDSVWSLFQSLNMFSTEVDKLDEDRVQKIYGESTTKLSDIQERISSLTEKLKHDFGVENEFYLLYDRCFETKQDKYVYKICPFKDAYQEEGYSKTELGQWEKFENAYSTMLFSNGNRCWNGPDRSLKVKLRCGVKTELADVDEPSRCEYVARLSTPVRCLEGKLEELERKLESMFKDQHHNHDEL